MKYKQIDAAEVFVLVTGGYNIVICDIEENTIKETNYLTVEDIRNYTSKDNVVFLVANDE